MKLKKLLALTLALVLVFAMSTTALADNAVTGGLEGGGTVEGTVTEEADVFTVELPTNASFDFIMDPEGLIAATDAEKYTSAEGATLTKDDFVSTTGLYFANYTTTGDGEDAVTAISGYSEQSDVLTITNKGNVAITVDLTATLTDYGTVAVKGDTTFSTTDADAGTTAAPEIYLALKNGTVTDGAFAAGSDAADTVAVATAGTDKYTGDLYTDESVAAAEHSEEAEVVYENGAYVSKYPDGDVVTYSSLNFVVTGAVNQNADWSALTSVAPKLALTWTIEPPADYTPAGPSFSPSSLTLTAGSPATAVINLNGNESTSVSSITVDGAAVPVARCSRTYDEDAGTITLAFDATFTTNWTVEINAAGKAIVTLSDNTVLELPMAYGS